MFLVRISHRLKISHYHYWFILPLLTMGLAQSAETPVTAKRGIYFPKKQYIETVLPTFDQAREMLPQPVLDGNPGWVELYWKCWRLAFDHLRKPVPGSPFVSNYIDEAFNPNIFQWDTIFMVMFWRYAHHIFPAAQSFDNFYCCQHEDGYICREIVEKTGEDFIFGGIENTINPPLFSWAEKEYYRISGDKSRFTEVMPVLEKYVAWLEQNRMNNQARHGLYWQTGLGSGMDNTPQRGSAWVDMSAQMVRQYDDLAFMAHELDLPAKAAQYRQRAQEISQKINDLMWDESRGFYWNLDDAGNWLPCKTIGFSWTLMAGIPSAARAKTVADKLFDPNTFYRLIPFATLAADEKEYNSHGGYWLGASWAPTTYQAIKGLERYDFYEYARQATEKYLAGMYEVFKKTNTVWENYAPDYYESGDPAAGDFVGWSGVGPIALLFENIIGVDADAIHHRITWRIHRTDRHGIEGLRIGKNMLTLICEPRPASDSPAVVNLKTELPYTIVLVHPQGEKTINLAPGLTQVQIP